MKTARLDIRLSLALKERVEEAAALLGLSATEFTTKALEEKTEKTRQAHEVLILANEDRDLLLASLESPPKSIPALREAFQWYEEVNERKQSAGGSRRRKPRKNA